MFKAFTSNRMFRNGAHAFAVLAFCVFMAQGLYAGSAQAETRTLKLYYLHTGEKTKVTYYKNGRYLASGLKKANWALRDWRRNEPTKMDPKLLDLVWEAYRRSGSKAWIHVISGYRSPATNEKLRKRGGGQAKKSQHTRGKALDFFLPDVKISKMREIGLKLGVGGVGYYPRSGSPFVHLDTGNVRHWPRMSRKQLARIFPNGKTMHVPSDGKPLAGYKSAVASYKRRQRSGKSIAVSAEPTKKELNFFQRLAALTRKDQEDDEQENSAPAPRAVATRQVEKKQQEPEKQPEPVVPENEFASLPRRNVPVPVSAPRSNSISDGNEIVVAAAEPEKVETPSVSEAEIAAVPAPTPGNVPPNTSDAAVEAASGLVNDPSGEEKPETGDTLEAVTAFLVPVPSKRPDYQPQTPADVLVAALEANDGDRSSTVEFPVDRFEAAPTSVLSLQEEPQDERPATRIAALTPSEIEDIRRLAKPRMPKVEASVSSSVPRPSVNVGENSVIQPQIPAATESQTMAAVRQPAAISANEIAIPDTNPRAETMTAVETPAPAPKPSSENLEPEIQETRVQTASANVPVPTPRPLRDSETQADNFVVASLKLSESKEANVAERLQNDGEAPVKITGNAAQLRQRTVSLDKLSAPQDNKSSIGQFALSADTSIRELSKVQAPAYGRNMIRNAPTMVLNEGFRYNLPGTRQGFSGKAVVFRKFSQLKN